MPWRDRHSERERALELCYELDQRDVLPAALIASLAEPLDEFASKLVIGVYENKAALDLLISEFAEHWSIDRMPVIDRNILRLGAFELGWCPDTPLAVVITEAVDLAKLYSTRDSGRFINGLLSRIAERLRPANLAGDVR